MDVIRRPDLTRNFRETYLTSVEEIEAEIDSAIQIGPPQKTHLKLEDASIFGQWPVLISTRGEKHLRKAHRRDGKICQIFAKKIRELSNGHFSRDNQKPLTDLTGAVPIFEAKMTGDTRLVYHIDIIPDLSTLGTETQAIRILGIHSHAEIHSLRSFWTIVSKQLSNNGREYVQRCIERIEPFHPGDNSITTPKQYHSSEFQQDSRFQLSEEDTCEQDFQNAHSMLRLDKFTPVSKILLHSVYLHLELDHVFQIESKEREIIEHDSACYVLGRSGTGKTTTMVFKMLAVEWSSQSNKHTPKPRQLFVTQSQTLAEKVKEYFLKLFRSKEAATMSPSELKKFAAFEHARIRKRKDEENMALVHPEDLEGRKNHLPERFSLLRDEHFPLFITYNDLCTLLEADLLSSPDIGSNPTESPALFGDMRARLLPSADGMQLRRFRPVSLDDFVGSYWRHLPQDLTRGLKPALVFAEFMGVIKGSEKSLDFSEGFIDRQTYIESTPGSQMTFYDRREQIYSLFEAYTKLKRQNGDQDIADRTHKIIRLILQQGLLGPKIDYLFILPLIWSSQAKINF